MPIDSHKLRASSPIAMRVIVGRIEPQSLGIYPNDMCSIVLDQVRHALLENLVRRLLRERKDVFSGIMFLLIEPTAFHTDSVHEQRRESS